MSHKTSRNCPEVWVESESFPGAREAGFTHENAADNTERTSAKRGWVTVHQVSSCKNNAADDEGSQSTNDLINNKTRNCIRELEHKLNKSPAATAIDSHYGCTEADSEKRSDFLVCSEINISHWVDDGALKQTGRDNQQEIHVGRIIEEHYGSCAPQQNNTLSRVELILDRTVVENVHQNCLFRSQTTRRDGQGREISTSLSTSYESQSLASENKFQDTLKKECSNFKDVYKKPEMSSVMRIVSSFSPPSYEQSLPLKCRSSVSIKPYVPRIKRHWSFDKTLDVHTESLNRDMPQSTVRESLCACAKSLHLSTVIGQENNISARPLDVSEFRDTKIASSNIQRIQEQLRRKIDSNKVNIQHQESKFSKASSLQKQEKPYRQWHRMSRVLTAENKFIISHMLPSYTFTKTMKKVDNNRQEMQEKLEEVSKDETECLLANEKAKWSVEVSETSRTTSSGNESESRKENVDDAKQTSQILLPLEKTKIESDKLQELENGVNVLTCSKTFGVSGMDGREHKEKLSKENWLKTKFNGKNSSEEIKTKICKLSAVSGTQEPTSITPIPLPRKTMYGIKLNTTNMEEVENGENGYIGYNADFISRDAINKIQPLNSFSGSSQVSGPCYSRHKGEFVREFPSKKPVIGPRLRTEVRSRNRCKSPNNVSAHRTHAFEGNEAQSPQRSDRKIRAREISKHEVMHSRHGSSSSSSLRIHYEKTTNKQCTSHEESGKKEPPELNTGLNRNCCSSWNVICAENQGQLGSKKHKVSLADVANKLLKKVNPTGLRVRWSESTKKYTDVQATADFNGVLPGQLSFKKGQKIKQRSFDSRASDVMSYGYYRVGRFRKKKKGLFPSIYVTANITDDVGLPDTVSLLSSAKSTVNYNSDESKDD